MLAIDYPVIDIGPHKGLVVRHSHAAQILMRRRGLDPARAHLLMRATKRRQEDGTIVDVANGCEAWRDNTYLYFSCCVAENFVDKANPSRVNLDVAPTADYWAMVCEDFQALELACWQAMGKALEAERQKQPAPPLPTTEPRLTN
jgi:hypothetical protein